jgi:hypothetical protein
MKPIFIPRDVSTGETDATGVTRVHKSSLQSATVNDVVQCGIFHRHRGNLLHRAHETQQLQEAPSFSDTCSAIYVRLKHIVYALRT